MASLRLGAAGLFLAGLFAGLAVLPARAQEERFVVEPLVGHLLQSEGYPSRDDGRLALGLRVQRRRTYDSYLFAEVVAFPVSGSGARHVRWLASIGPGSVLIDRDASGVGLRLQAGLGVMNAAEVTDWVYDPVDPYRPPRRIVERRWNLLISSAIEAEFETTRHVLLRLGLAPYLAMHGVGDPTDSRWETPGILLTAGLGLAL